MTGIIIGTVILSYLLFRYFMRKQDAQAYTDISASDLRNKLSANETIVLLDVRTPDEIAHGKIAGALEFDFNRSDFSHKIASLDKNKKYMVYCRSGNRSAKACKMMSQMGFIELYNLSGGFNAWK